MRRTLTASLLTLLTAVVALPAWAVSLDVDPTFSGDGVMRWPLKNGTVRDIARDGRQYVAVGDFVVDGTVQRGIFIARINQDGTLDNTYGVNGVATAVLGDSASSPQVAVEADGTAVTATRSSDVVLAHRWTADGELDTSFSTDGVRELPLGPLHRWTANPVTVDSQGRVVVAAMTKAAKGEDTRIVRLNADGSRDDTFGANGRVTINLDITDQPDALEVDARDRVLLALDFYPLSPGKSKYAYRSGVVRLRQTGAYDRKFSNDGLVLFNLTRGGVSYPLALDEDAAARIVVAAYDVSSGSYGVVRLLRTGKVDATFGHRGTISVVCRCSIYAADVRNGRVAFVANRLVKNTREFVVARVDADGTRTHLWEGDLLAADEKGFATAVLVDGRRTLVAGGSLNRPFIARLG